MIRKTTLAILLAGLVMAAAPRLAQAYQYDYGQDVQFQGQPSPVDEVTGLSVDQYGAGQTNSQIDNYIYQNEQLNLSEDSGVVRVLRTNQKEQINKYVTAFIPLNAVTVRELRGLARTICRTEGGDADVINDKVRHRNGICVVCPPHLVGPLTQTLQALDKAWVKEYNDGSWFVYYKAKNRNIRSIVNTLMFYRTPDAAWEFDDANNAVAWYDQPCIEGLFNKGTKDIDIMPSQIMFDVGIYELDTQNDLVLGLDWESWKNGPGRDLFQFVAWDFWGKDKSSIFPGTMPFNGADWGTFRSYNFRLTTAYIDFLASKGKARLVTKSTITAKSGTVGEISAVDQVVAFQSNSTPATFDQTFEAPFRLSDVWDFYHKQGEAEPDIEDLVELTASQINAKVTDLFHDEDIPNIEEVQEQINHYGKDGKITRAELEAIHVPACVTLKLFRDRTLRYANDGQTGVLLTVFPVVGLESAEVAMALDVSDVTDYTPAGMPIIEHRYVSSQVEVKDGQPFILGGLNRSQTVKTGSGIPFLRDIPYAGYAFGREVTTKRQKEMVVLVTPRFHLCPLNDPNPPKELETVLKLANTPVADKEKLLSVPKDAFGFDQWVLDAIAERRMNPALKQ